MKFKVGDIVYLADKSILYKNGVSKEEYLNNYENRLGIINKIYGNPEIGDDNNCYVIGELRSALNSGNFFKESDICYPKEEIMVLEKLKR